MKPVIVLVGRPNVGKSTLFNALTRSRDALVADEPGLTRDRQYGNGRVGDRPYIVVDTGGITQETDALRAVMSVQTQQAMEEADAIIFLTDGRAGINTIDRGIADNLRRRGKQVILAVNKTEGMDPVVATADFHSLGLGVPVALSAAHGDGLHGLMQRALANVPHVQEEASEDGGAPRIAVAGRPNVGKSTLVNALLGEERVVVFDQPGTTRDSIRIPLERQDKHYILIDTAGVRKRGRITDVLEKYSVIKTLQAIEEANGVVLVLDARQEISEQDVSLAGYILEQGRSVVLAVNKWDGIEDAQREWIKRELERKLPFLSFASLHFISALNHTGIGGLFPAIDRAFLSARRVLPTPRLNKVMQLAVQATPPPIYHGRRIKLKFAHQGGKNPPRVVIHGNQVAAVPESYQRYLSNVFRKAFKLEGTPVMIEFVQGENPYEGKKKVLTRRQHEAAKRIRRIRKKKYAD